MSDLLQLDMMLLNWQKTATGGAKVVFQITPEDLEKFEPLTIAKGGKGGQRFMAALALYTDDDLQAPLPNGALCRQCVIWCKEVAFQEWLAQAYPTTWGECVATNPIDAAKEVVCILCGVTSRKDLDYAVDAARMYHELIRKPYAEFLGRQA